MKRIKVGDLVKSVSSEREIKNCMTRFKQRSDSTVFLLALQMNIPLGWTGSEPEAVWVVVEKNCSGSRSLQEQHFDPGLFAGVDFYKCRSSDGRIKVCPDFSITKI